MAPEILAVITDTNLTPEACRIVLYVAALGAGDQHEVKHTRFSSLLNHPGEKRLRASIQLAVDSGYLERTPGGRGHADRYEFSPAAVAGLKALSPAAGADLKPPVVEGEGDIPPNSPPLSFPAMRAIGDAGEKLTGCRGSLRDYLTARVEIGRQYAYVQTVLSWIDNPSQVFQQANGVLVPPHERLSLLAIALNELAASDESKYKAPTGDVRNLKNKLGILAKGFGVKATGTDGASGYRPRSAASDTQDYKPTTEWRGFNG